MEGHPDATTEGAIASSVAGILREAEELLAFRQAEHDDVVLVRSLRKLLKRANPARRKVNVLDGNGDSAKRDIAGASVAELMAALRLEAESAQRRNPTHLTPYKRVEKRFREPPTIDAGYKPGPEAVDYIFTVNDAVESGAIDFSIHDPRVVCLLAPGDVSTLPASGSPRLSGFTPHGGVYALADPAYAGFYIMPAAETGLPSF